MVKKKNKKTNKKGWIKIVEAFLAIVVLLGFLFIILAQYNFSNDEIGTIKENNDMVLNGIQSNSSLRNSVFSIETPAHSDDGGFPEDLKDYIEKETLAGSSCLLYICEIGDVCLLTEEASNEVYSSEAFIFSGTNVYSPRKLKIFCYYN